MTEPDSPRKFQDDRPLTPEEIAALEAMRMAQATGDASDSMAGHPALAKLLADTGPALEAFDRVTDVAIEGFDAERARYAIEQRTRSDALLWRSARWVFPVFLLSGVAIELMRAQSEHRTPDLQALLFQATAATIGTAFLVLPMLRRRKLAMQALAKGPIELQVDFERMRHSSRKQRMLTQACLLFGGLAMLMSGTIAAIEGRWFVAASTLLAVASMAIFARHHRRSHDEALFAGRISAEDWLRGPGARKGM